MNEKKITLSFSLEEVANDILAKCNLISVGVRDEAMEDIRANIQEPDGPETRSIINRAITEAFGNVKSACQRYLRVGRLNDNNDLERIVRSVTFTKDGSGHDTDQIDTITYETVVLELWIPNFNVSVTDALKSNIHKYVVNYTMWRFLQDQHGDKAAEYKQLADTEDHRNILHNLNARERFNQRKPSWV